LHFEPTPLEGAWILDLDRRIDERGFFSRTWCREEFAGRGLVTDLAQANLSHSTYRGTIRGMHYQVAPAQEAKLVQCVRGAIWDVIIDIRPDSATFRAWFGIELTSENHRQLYVPKDFAHGYQTLVEDTEVFYLSSTAYAPAAERGIRWNDPLIAVTWPIPNEVRVSAKDREWPDFDPGPISVGPDRPAYPRTEHDHRR
jgi:dTDP-4-dehydrorhamnose 3,5-epimerase